MAEILGYPLCWPVGWPRTKSPEWSRFQTSKTTFGSIRQELVHEIEIMGGRQIVLSTNIPLKKDGMPYATYKPLTDTGIAVYFTLKGQPKVFACDKWRKIEDNMRAIQKTIEAIRGIDRWGSSEIMDRIYRGFQALPAQSTYLDDAWWVVLGVNADAGSEETKRAYRSLAKSSHPDVGGDEKLFKKYAEAYEQAEKYFESKVTK